MQWNRPVEKSNKDGLEDARQALTRIQALDDVTVSNDADASDWMRQPRRWDSASVCTSDWKGWNGWRQPYDDTPAAVHARSQQTAMAYARRRRPARHVLKAWCWGEPYDQTRATPHDRDEQRYRGLDLRRRPARHVQKKCCPRAFRGRLARQNLDKPERARYQWCGRADMCVV